MDEGEIKKEEEILEVHMERWTVKRILEKEFRNPLKII